jgi:hypothetical protein
MLTDNEVADTACRLLADELADLAPPADLLSAVRARHSARRSRRAVTITAACTAVVGVTTAAVAGTTLASHPAAHPVAARSQPTQAGSRPAHDAPAQAITVDGYTISLSKPVPAVKETVILASSAPRGHGTQRIFAFPLWLAGRVPPAAVAVHTPGRAAREYLLRARSKVSVYVRLPVADGQIHFLAMSAPRADEALLLRVAPVITLRQRLAPRQRS